jgi:hypothetical protein
MRNLGLGVMLNMLGSNEETVLALKQSLGKTIKNFSVNEDDPHILINFEEDSALKIWDDGQSCCENRYVRTDDKPETFKGAKILKYELEDGPNQDKEEEEEEDYGRHEVQFFRILTDKGIIIFSNHNEHNGYYGGFSIAARIV